MADYTIFFKPSAQKELEKLEADLVETIYQEIVSLARIPRPPGCKKLHEYNDQWRIRIGDYRVLYSIDDKARTVRILAVKHRREAYL